MEDFIKCAVAFTGHRNIAPEKIPALKVKLEKAVREQYDQGMREFICGMALGFDMMAAEIVLSLREELPDIYLTAVIPFAGQPDRWAQENRDRYRLILDKADEVITLSDKFYKGCEMKRNAFMLDYCSRVIAYFNGEPHGGTCFTVNSALKRGKTVINLY